jgi:hypothetical protein
MRHLLLRCASAMVLCAGLAGCGHFHDYSKDVATKCVHVTGSFLCQNEDEAADSVKSGSDPSIQMHTVQPRD